MIPNISALKLSLMGPSTGRGEEYKTRWCGCQVVMNHATDMLLGVALPSLTMSRDGRANMATKSGTMMGLRRMVPIRRLWLKDNIFGRCNRAGGIGD